MSRHFAMPMDPTPRSHHPTKHDSLEVISRAETYLCLARAFLPPMAPGMLEALRHDLLEDLANLHAEVPISDSTPDRIDALRYSLEGVPDDQALLREYSRLFLSPPAPAMLNLGFHLDGGIMGGSTRQMEAWYQRHGLERDPSFRDLPDHLVLNLQFLAWVLGAAAESSGNDGDTEMQGLRDARDLIARFTLPGVHALKGKIEAAIEEHRLSATYAALSSLLADVLMRDLEFLSARLPAQALQTDPSAAEAKETQPDALPETDPEGRLACRICGTEFAAGEALAGMIARLQAAGLATEHLAVCPDCRTETMGMRPLTPPTPKR
jgi:putative dimethyl sulfoxide reductase chaperone